MKLLKIRRKGNIEPVLRQQAVDVMEIVHITHKADRSLVAREMKGVSPSRLDSAEKSDEAVEAKEMGAFYSRSQMKQMGNLKKSSVKKMVEALNGISLWQHYDGQ
jgi:hypothetical protein